MKFNLIVVLAKDFEAGISMIITCERTSELSDELSESCMLFAKTSGDIY